MEEAYKVLNKSEHIHWDKFKKLHSTGIVNFVNSILGEEIEETLFIETYSKLTSRQNRPSRRKSRGKKMYKFLKKYGWIL